VPERPNSGLRPLASPASADVPWYQRKRCGTPSADRRGQFGRRARAMVPRVFNLQSKKGCVGLALGANGMRRQGEDSGVALGRTRQLPPGSALALRFPLVRQRASHREVPPSIVSSTLAGKLLAAPEGDSDLRG